MQKSFFVFLLLFGISVSAFAQRISYPQLVQRTERPTFFIDDLSLPGENGKTNLVFTFRFNNNFIPFRKLPVQHTFNAPEDAGFYSTLRLNTEIFEGKLKRRGEPAVNSVSRDVWADTVYTSTFEETQSADQYASGVLSVNLDPGNYHYIFQLSMLQEKNERSTQRRNIKIENLREKETGEVYLLKKVENRDIELNLQLMNMADNVPFGDDFTTLIRIPEYEEGAEYQLKINRAREVRDDTTTGAEIYTYSLKPAEIHAQSTVKLASSEEPSLSLTKGNHPYTYALVSVPGSTLENAFYQMTLHKNGSEDALATGYFRSYWPDMPASLYNLNIAIEHLKFIASEKQIEQIDKGNRKEKEEKFRAFWGQRDPTPNTVYNELMAEYYRRIDYAFKEFGSQENPMGHESDQGEVYIKFGPPNSKERVFPPGGTTREVWKYPNRSFVFEATTGFGDFKLVGTK
ncbi:GWxTD domain-containing protein [Gracilimonas mengyeensis]|uniref:GWxTD domain-containing protein n=1 Tax=Gracilimonas mengyeensis TaxID=1302730 RepID=A0A521D7Z6_9BACT|nr:GWxTD domain-containing protein [Gracilimonas mengyeensis]SMO67818.1 GWxTD domain-containing protein [Gracilimonas mengyeensis]